MICSSRWCTKINGECYWYDCANCPTCTNDNSQPFLEWKIDWIYPNWIYSSWKYQQPTCNKGKIMVIFGKCDKCKYNPINCSDFEESEKK